MLTLRFKAMLLKDAFTSPRRYFHLEAGRSHSQEALGGGGALFSIEGVDAALLELPTVVGLKA